MNMLKVRFVFIILAFQVVTAEYLAKSYGDESIERDDDDGGNYGYRSKSKETHHDESNSSEDKSSSDHCGEGKVNCKSKKRPQPDDDDSYNSDEKSPSDKKKIPKTDNDDSNGSDDKSSSQECDRDKGNCPSNKSSQRGSSNRGNNNMQEGACNKCGIAYGGPESDRVINGRPVKPVYKYPWIVPVIRENNITCGGALISETFVMTAAYCVMNLLKSRQSECQKQGPPSSCYLKPNMFKVEILGSKRRNPNDPPNTVAVRRIIPHPKYYDPGTMYDIALLQLARPVSCGSTVMPVCLPPIDFHKIGTKLIAVGTGFNSPAGRVGSEMLREGIVTEVDPRRCLRGNQPRNFTQNLVCAAGLESRQSSCYGNIGSALFGKFGNKFYAVGVVSYGTFPMCSQQLPTAYHRVYTSLNFIKRHVNDLPRV